MRPATVAGRARRRNAALASGNVAPRCHWPACCDVAAEKGDPPALCQLALCPDPIAPQFEKAIEMDLRGMSRSGIAQLFASQPLSGSRRKLMTIAMPAGIADEARLKVMADLSAAVVLVGERHGIGLAVSPRTRCLTPAG